MSDGVRHSFVSSVIGLPSSSSGVFGSSVGSSVGASVGASVTGSVSEGAVSVGSVASVCAEASSGLPKMSTSGICAGSYVEVNVS